MGLWTGFLGGPLDFFVMRIVDILMAFPGILLALLLSSILGPNIHNVVFAIAATGWISTARIVRAQTLQVKSKEFVLSLHALGASSSRIVFKHILPNVVPTLLIQATFSLSGVIIIEAGLSFLGLGAPSTTPTWGALLNQGRSVLTEAPLLAIAPGFCIFLTVLSLNFLGDSIRDALDPKSTL
jgi:peptide/nickel transport system permease protein